MSPTSTSRPPSDPPIRRERYLYTYSLLAASTPLQFLITYVFLNLYATLNLSEMLESSLYLVNQNLENIRSSSPSEPTGSNDLSENLLFADFMSIHGHSTLLFCGCSASVRQLWNYY